MRSRARRGEALLRIGLPCSVTSYKIAAGGAPEGAPAQRLGGQGASQKVPQETCAVPALRLPQGGNEKTRENPGEPTGKSGDPRSHCVEPRTHVCMEGRRCGA